MRLGLTGGYCAGKNAAAALLAAKGWDCVDVDALGHEAMGLARDRIVERFGRGILGPDGAVDRRALARVVFSDPRALADQEAIVHPVAIELLEARIALAEERARAAGAEPLVCVNAALLHRVPRLAGCAVVVEVRAPLPLRLARALARDRAGPAAAIRRFWRQRGFRKAFLAEARASGAAVLPISNAGSREDLARALDAALALARALAQAQARGPARAARDDHGSLGPSEPRP